MIATAEAARADWKLLYGGRVRASMAFLDELAPYGDRVSVRSREIPGFRLSDRSGHSAQRPARKHAHLLLRAGSAAGRGRAVFSAT